MFRKKLTPRHLYSVLQTASENVLLTDSSMYYCNGSRGSRICCIPIIYELGSTHVSSSGWKLRSHFHFNFLHVIQLYLIVGPIQLVSHTVIDRSRCLEFKA